jgi:hypothetical protein
MRVLCVALVIGCVVMTTACDGFMATPTPTPAPPGDIPVQVVDARDAVLSYVRHAYGRSAPPEELLWVGRNTTPEGMVGASSYEFEGNKWLMTILANMASPNNVFYQAGLRSEDEGFFWAGELSTSYAILESNLEVAHEVLGVRDGILSYIRQNYPDQAPAEGLVWVGERTTPEGSVGRESCRFASEDWLMTVTYDLVLPRPGIYYIEVTHANTEFLWRGQIGAEGEIMEVR